MSMTSPSKKTLRAVSNSVLVLVTIAFALPLLWLVLASVDTSATLSIKLP